MPKAAIHENDNASIGKEQIRPAGKPGRVKPPALQTSAD